MQNNNRTALTLFATALLVVLGICVASRQDSVVESIDPVDPVSVLQGDLDAQPDALLPAAGQLLNPVGSGIEASALVEQQAVAAGLERVAITRAEAASADLVVLAKDTSGQPLPGLWVWISSTPDDRSTFRAEPFHALSDEHGRMVFKDVRKTLLPDTDWYLVHDVAFEELPRTRLTPALLELPEVITVQPDSGSIVVKITEFDGTASQRVERLELQLVLDEEHDDPRLALTRQSFVGTPAEGNCAYPFVELGRHWTVLAKRGNGFDGHASADGPRRVGESVQIDLQYGSDRPILLLRAVTEGGAPLREAGLTLHIQTIFGVREDEKVRTDATGEFAAHFGLDGAGMLNSELHASHASSDGQTLAFVRK